jgi:hypothetical protein
MKYWLQVPAVYPLLTFFALYLDTQVQLRETTEGTHKLSVYMMEIVYAERYATDTSIVPDAMKNWALQLVVTISVMVIASVTCGHSIRQTGSMTVLRATNPIRIVIRAN